MTICLVTLIILRPHATKKEILAIAIMTKRVIFIQVDSFTLMVLTTNILQFAPVRGTYTSMESKEDISEM